MVCARPWELTVRRRAVWPAQRRAAAPVARPSRFLDPAAVPAVPAAQPSPAFDPAAAEAAVFGIPDEQWVESVCAAIVLRPGMTTSDTELVDYCKKRLASYKKPRTVAFLGALPKNEWGKTLKDVLKAPYWKDAGRRI